MASTIKSASTNGAPGNTLYATQNTRQPLRPNVKGADNVRRSSGGPVDAGQRRSNSQKAWTQGTNPITQKPTPYPEQNGSAPSTGPKQMTAESNTPSHHAHNRLVFLMTSFIGATATVTTRHGEQFSGIFSSSTLEPTDTTVTLKMVQRISPQAETRSNGLSDTASPFLGSPPDHSMIFDMKEVADIAMADVSTSGVTTKDTNGTSAGFRTDADIAGGMAVRERPLERWVPPEDVKDLGGELEDTKHVGPWDQFKENEKRFGIKVTDHDMVLRNYTTELPSSNDPDFEKKRAEAARIAREIESAQTDNPHIKEERGQVPEGDGHDEEEKYSGVRRDQTAFPPLPSGQPNKYLPPARRAQQTSAATTTTSQPPDDPAIISAQRTKPEAPKTEPKDAAQPKSEPQEKVRPPATTQPAASTTVAPSKIGIPKRTGAENATSSVETEVLDQFRQFANSEKQRVQERRRNQASHDRTVKLNELMKFSQNFKLATPVPKDLVPILAKDPSKQEQIIERAQRQAEERAAAKAAAQAQAQKAQAQAKQVTPAQSQSPSQPQPPSSDQKPATTRGTAAPATTSTAPSSVSTDRSTFTRGRQPYIPGPRPNQNFHPGRVGTLSHRLADNLRQQKVNMGAIPPPLPLQDVRVPPMAAPNDQSAVPSPSKSHTPTSTSSTKLNVKAMEFKPNPTASSFTPGVGLVGASPQLSSRGRSVSRTATPSAFFGNKKPVPASERPSVNDLFSPLDRLKKEAEEQKDKDYSFNRGIPPSYRTGPTWDLGQEGQNVSYADMFRTPPLSISPQGRPASHPNLPPHQPPLPYHMPQGSQTLPSTGPAHGPHHLQPQQHPGSHFDDHHHRVQMSASTSQMFSSPRLQQSHMAYPSPMPPHAQLAYGQPVPQFYVNQGGPSPGHMRPYPGGPQYVNPPNGMGAPMMVQQPSSGPYIGVPQAMAAPYNPQMPMYSPTPGHAFPQHGAPPPQPHSGYPSPGRGAPMMMHQGSQPSQPPMVFMNPGQPGQPMYGPQQGQVPLGRGGYPQQPHYSSSPHQPQHYAPHQPRGPGNNYGPPPQAPPANSQPSPSAGSGQHGSENNEDAK